MNFICPKCGCHYEADEPLCPACGYKPKDYTVQPPANVKAEQKRMKNEIGAARYTFIKIFMITLVAIVGLTVLWLVYDGLTEQGLLAKAGFAWFILRLLFPPLFFLL